MKQLKTNVSGTKILLEELSQKIERKIKNLESLQQFKDYLKSDDSLEVFQWELVDKIIKRHQSFSLDDKTVSWIFNNSYVMQTLMTSGDVDGDKYKEAIDIIAEIIRQDPNAKSGLRLKLAIAVGLTFSSKVPSLADGSSIDGIARYHNFSKWADERVLFEPFYNLNTWQMRYVVGSWAKDEEMVWARENAFEGYRDPNKIGTVTFKMVKYTMYNADGISVQSKDFYYGLPVTLETIHTYGGVCGAISKFGTAMAQSFGIPGLPVGQPGHCAFIWLKNGTEWKLSNDVSGWTKSTTHLPVMYSWKRPAPFFTMMHEAQLNPDAYRLSEKMRILASSFVDPKFKYELLEDANTVCPQNYDLYNELKETMSEQTVDRDLVEKQMVPYLEEYHKDNFETVKDVAFKKDATASEFQDRANKITDGTGSHWYSNETSAWVEIDLENPCTINEMKINWWGTSYSSNFDVLAEINNTFVKVLTQSDETRQSKFNGWGVFPGWDGRTTKVRLEMRQGRKDPWKGKYYFGIRQVVMTGKEHLFVENLSLSRPVASNIAGTGKELVDGNISTYWTSDVRKSWIEIQFKSLCSLDHVLIDWLYDIQGRQNIQYLVGGRSHEVMGWGKFDKVEMSGIGGELKILLQRSNNYSIREVSVFGYCFSTRDIFKMKVSQGFATPDTSYSSYVLKDISEIIGEFECDSCF